MQHAVGVVGQTARIATHRDEVVERRGGEEQQLNGEHDEPQVLVTAAAAAAVVDECDQAWKDECEVDGGERGEQKAHGCARQEATRRVAHIAGRDAASCAQHRIRVVRRRHT